MDVFSFVLASTIGLSRSSIMSNLISEISSWLFNSLLNASIKTLINLSNVFQAESFNEEREEIIYVVESIPESIG